MYEKLLQILKEKGFHSIIVKICSPNYPSEKLHQDFGFKQCGELTDSGFKFNRWYTVSLWQLMLDEYDPTKIWLLTLLIFEYVIKIRSTLESGIGVAPWISVASDKFDKKNNLAP